MFSGCLFAIGCKGGTARTILNVFLIEYCIQGGSLQIKHLHEHIREGKVRRGVGNGGAVVTKGGGGRVWRW